MTVITPSPAPVVPGWVGGFATSNTAFAYPTPDLSSLPMLDNLANIPLLQRQLGIAWPEFSWLTQPGLESSRCFQMFSPYISRVGYTDEGRIYSIICPQQGIWIPNIGCLNVEVTVTGQRGWVNEATPLQALAADMTVEAKIWFSPSATQSLFVKLLWAMFANCGLPFPASKANAIRVATYDPGSPAQPIFPVRAGQNPAFANPSFALHPEAWGVGNIGVAIGDPIPTTSPVVNDFNKLVMDLFNIASGNMLRSGSTLTWNVWFVAPALVDQQEWATHAERWRTSIDEDHGSPTGPGTVARFFNGTEFHPLQADIDAKTNEIIASMTSNMNSFCKV
ncbi:hypothetical protein Q5H93_00515 [Hymenobacter sp. ASUV-10]|uniref:Uncharacterized protein n=1 Tax=Hymenobacter aranciens TaxID=3063996 RepID=A0ABT9B4Y1_9BACT|nr:hypothetical protein [Hymenobacter sp. ASUV-10]MDO7873197.1 hypothetical protein [Hymenobacter sp. ASUV-10]